VRDGVPVVDLPDVEQLELYVSIIEVASAARNPVPGSQVIIKNFTASKPPNAGGDPVIVQQPNRGAPFTTTITFHYGRETAPRDQGRRACTTSIRLFGDRAKLCRRACFAHVHIVPCQLAQNSIGGTGRGVGAKQCWTRNVSAYFPGINPEMAASPTGMRIHPSKA
jgi:hypothetical protein